MAVSVLWLFLAVPRVGLWCVIVVFPGHTHILNGPHCEKTCLPGFTNNTGSDQSAHPPSLISAFVIRIL